MNAEFWVKKAGRQIFSFKFPIVAGLPFSDCVKAALDRFETSFPDVSLYDDDVEFGVSRA